MVVMVVVRMIVVAVDGWDDGVMVLVEVVM